MRTVIARGGLAVAMGISMSTATLAFAQGRPATGAPPATVPGAAPGTTPAPGVAPATGVAPASPQTASPANPGLGPTQPLPGGPGVNATANQTVSSAPAAPSTMDETIPVEVPSGLVEVRSGGLTADQAGMMSMSTSWNAKASMEAVKSASAKVDEAWAGFLPRLSGVAKYTRLSNFSSPPFFNTGNAGLVVGPIGAINTVNELRGIAVTFPPFFQVNNFLLQATLNVPISDYFFSIDQQYTAATRSEEAAHWDLVSQKTTAGANGKIQYYTWLRNRGAVIVAAQALNDQKAHLRDSRNQFTVGNASKADVLRAETSVSSAELALEQAQNLSDLTEKQLRIAMHASPDQAFVPGEDLAAPMTPILGNLQQMTVEALSARPEIKSADANAEAAHEQAAAAKAGRYPSLSAFADGILGDPNPRQVPPSQEFFGTWDLGAQLTWSPNDILVANGNVRDFESRVSQIVANKGNTRDGIEVEVQQEWQGVREADFSVDSSTREVTSAEEAYRVQHELFNNGRGTSATLTDAESDLTKARLDLLNARANARIARVRLDHALGRDVAAATAPAGSGGSSVPGSGGPGPTH
jgi:outer membrane protein TolC